MGCVMAGMTFTVLKELHTLDPHCAAAMTELLHTHPVTDTVDRPEQHNSKGTVIKRRRGGGGEPSSTSGQQWMRSVVVSWLTRSRAN
jgi:hypothetical protein